MDAQQLLQVLAGHESMELVLSLEAQAFKYALVTSCRVARRTRENKVIGRIVSAPILRDQVVRGKIIDRPTEDALLRQF
jgi:hypothetical protein